MVALHQSLSRTWTCATAASAPCGSFRGVNSNAGRSDLRRGVPGCPGSSPGACKEEKEREEKDEEKEKD